jgi:hypothetical protein
MACLLSLKNLSLEKTASRHNPRCGCDRAIPFKQNELRKIKFLVLGARVRATNVPGEDLEKADVQFSRQCLAPKGRLIVK